MKKKGFTLIELLVVISIIAMLLAILMPALNKVKKIAMRVVCATNLKGLGTAEMVYANDYDDEFTLQGGGRPRMLSNATDYYDQPGFNWRRSDDDGSNITVGASLFLLVREADVGTKSFICPSGDEKEYDGANSNTTDLPDLVELWDFGSENDTNLGETSGPDSHVSYAFHMPYAGQNNSNTGSRGSYAASGTQSAAFALMADKNPWFDTKLTNAAGDADNFTANSYFLVNKPAYGRISGWDELEKWEIQISNTRTHDREGQNVVFGDGHASYENRPDVGQRNDNIYLPWARPTATVREGDIRVGGIAEVGGEVTDITQCVPVSSDDSVLVNDISGFGDTQFPNLD